MPAPGFEQQIYPNISLGAALDATGMKKDKFIITSVA